MTTVPEPDFTEAPPGALRELRRERWRSGGYVEGWQWIREVKGNADTLRRRALEIEQTLNSPYQKETSMAPGASPRLYQEGFLRAVTTALGYIDSAARQATEHSPR